MWLVFRWVLLCIFGLTVAGAPPNLAWGLEWGCTLATFNPIKDYSPLSPERPALNATVTNGIDCTGTPNRKVLVCVHIKTEDSQDQRYLAMGNYKLSFNLTTNGISAAFGSSDWYTQRSGATPYAALVTIGANGHGLADLPLYMSIPSDQWVAPGNYSALIPPVVLITYKVDAVGAYHTYGPLACTSDLIAGSVATGYNFRATVIDTCDISDPVPPLAFGHAPNLSTTVDAASPMKVRCTATTPYRVTLNSGLWPDDSNFFRERSGNKRRMRMGISSNHYIGYNLYQNAARTTPWREDEVLKTTPAGPVNGPWNGPWQDNTIYGRVPSQMSPPAVGAYSDSVIVTVIY